MSWKPEVKVSDNWERNGLVFATREEAEAYAYDLYRRWTITTGYRASEVDEPVNYLLVEGKLLPALKEGLNDVLQSDQW